MCCRVESTGAGPRVMFVPCALLDAADEPLRACNRAGGWLARSRVFTKTLRGVCPGWTGSSRRELRTWREGTGEPGRWVAARTRVRID